ncbi:MAG: peptide chain release factor 2 [Fibrobacterota bacterium]|nr:peptide chain release factor 2 [Fibrobacterota bacterium]QQS04091.1 MAG: peptide chain release factor 2 [Fibrobacterota bacterium]
MDLLDVRTRLDALYGYLDLDAKAREREELEFVSSQPGFWDKAEAAQASLKKMNLLKSWIDAWESLSTRQKDLVELLELAALENDESLVASLTADGDALETDLRKFELKKMLDGEDDGRDAILSITPGAGGTEAQDWAEMLMRQYSRWIERRGFQRAIMDLQDGDEAGIKGVTFEVKGEYAYGFLRPEIGVHRLVRISPYDSNARRHTSFASVYAYPLVEDVEIPGLKMEDVRVDTYRAQGAGGQHVNKTESAVRMTHNPTGIVVSCQTERSQVQNRENCLKMLRSKLYQHYREEEAKKREDKKAKKLKIEWGSQIRSYVLDDRRVKDLRTNVETSDTEGVLDGDIDQFINAYLLMEAEKAREG